MFENCRECQNEVFRFPSERNKTIHCFCDQSCAAKYNNRMFPKRRLKKQCKLCETYIIAKSTYCKECYEDLDKFKDVTLAQSMDLDGKRSAVYSKVRGKARTIYKNTKNNEICENCGFAHHIEISHIKAICTYPEDTMLSIINSIDNLIGLCPNCHWLLDNEKLTIEEIQLSKFYIKIGD